jgi:hypothetical protein
MAVRCSFPKRIERETIMSKGIRNFFAHCASIAGHTVVDIDVVSTFDESEEEVSKTIGIESGTEFQAIQIAEEVSLLGCASTVVESEKGFMVVPSLVPGGIPTLS